MTETETETTGDGLYLLFASNDHKLVGRSWIGASLIFSIGLVAVGIVMQLERASLGSNDILASDSAYQQLWTFFRTGGIFMVALPLMIGIATAVVPLQVGSPSLAFPRLASAAFWGWFFASIAHTISFVADGGLGPAGNTDPDATLLTLTSLGGMVIAIIAASVCIATTILALRPMGMSLTRVPMFSWSMLVATSVWLLSLPVLLANLVLTWADLQGRAPIAFGNGDRIWADLEWVFQQPQIYSFAIPVLGILAEITPVAAKIRQANREVLMALIGVFGALSFGAWAQHSFSRGASPEFESGNYIYEEFLYIAFGVAIFLPVIGILGGALDNFRRGSAPKPTAALVGALFGVLLLVAAVIIGALRVIPLWDALHEDNVILSSAGAQFGVILAAIVASAIGAISWWSPKIFGSFPKDAMAMGAAAAVFLGGLVLGVTDLVSAFLGQPDLSIASGVESGVEAMNAVSVIGMALLALGVLGLVGSVLASAKASDEEIPDDPWEGQTLEWAAPSPPPIGNFVEPIAELQSAAPLLDEFEEVS